MPHFPKPFFKHARGLWYVEIDRHQINLGPDRDAAFRCYHQMMAEQRPQRVTTDQLVVLVDAFLEWVQHNRAPDTYEWYRYRLQRFVSRFPDLRVRELRPHHVESWADSFRFSVTSKRNYLRSVKRCLKWGVKQGYVERNPVAHLEVPTADSKEALVSPDEYKTLLLFIPDGDFRDLVVVTWETGCRPQESLRVEARHVDLAHQRWVFPKSESKGKRQPRVVYLTDRALEITRRLMLKHPEGKLFRNSHGRAWSPDAANCAFDRVQIRIGRAEMQQRDECIPDALIQEKIALLRPTKVVKGVVRDKTAAELRCEAKQKLVRKRAAELVPRNSLYALRHSWATHALQKGIDALTVAVLMGHADPSTLAKVYQHLAHNPQHLLEQARKAAG